MDDIVPKLNESINKSFKKGIENNAWIQSFLAKVETGKNVQTQDVSTYARELGQEASKALIQGLQPSKLPDGKLYFNIAQRTIEPLIREVYAEVNAIASQVQKLEDKKTGIGLKAVKADYPEQRVNAIISKLVDEAMKGDETNGSN